MTEAAWVLANRANWDERVPIHMASAMYDVDGLRDGDRTLDPIVDALLGDISGLRIAHLQCHFGRDTLVLVRRGWLPDIEEWASIVAWLLKPGGRLVFADDHPVASVFDSSVKGADGLPGFYLPYFHEGQIVEDDGTDYADVDARLVHARAFEWLHPVSRVIGALLSAGLVLERFGEHDALPWRRFDGLFQGQDGLYRFRDRAWLPLSYTLDMRRPV